MTGGGGPKRPAPCELERVRRNWERVGGAAPPEAVPQRLGAVAAPLDPYPIAEELLQRARTLASSDFEDRAITLKPFFDRAAVLLATMRDGGAGPDAPALRADFIKTLDDIEELTDVFATTPR